jgi:hypothetical protein
MTRIADRLMRRMSDAFLLTRARATVRGYSADQHLAIRRLWGAACGRLVLADDTTDSQFAAATISLYREAACLLISAIAVSRGSVQPGTVLELLPSLQQLDQLAHNGALAPLPDCYAEAVSILDSTDLLALDGMARRKVADRRAAVENFAHWLRGQIEPRTLRRIWVASVVRLGVALALACGLLAWGIDASFRPKNVALHKPVMMSSKHPGTPDAAGATDGKVVAPFQAHTAIEADPWIAVDLGAVFKISKVKVYNRTDCLFGGAVPLTLEFSTDGIRFHSVDQRTTAFSGTWPWVYRPQDAPARFVRIHGHPGGYVVVTEIEVYGR